MPEERSHSWLVLAVVGCLLMSGAGSLVLEVVWSRLLRLVFGSTTLAVSTILIAYMLGLGLGGLFGGKITKRLKNGIRAYGFFEIAIGLYALAVPTILQFFPYINRTWLVTLSFWRSHATEISSIARRSRSARVVTPSTDVSGTTTTNSSPP